jgi:hypothetical protein
MCAGAHLSRSAIVFIGFYRNTSAMVTLNAAGLISTWPYDGESFDAKARSYKKASQVQCDTPPPPPETVGWTCRR